MRLRSLVILLGLVCLAWAVPAAAQNPYDSSILPYSTKQDPPPDPRKVPRFIDDHPREIDGLYAKRFLTSGPVLDWLEWLKSDWDVQRNQRIDRNANLIDLRKTIPEAGAVLMKVVDGTPRDALIKFNSEHDAAPHDALYAFSQARNMITVAEAEVTKAQATIAASNASVDAAVAGQSILVSTNELATLGSRKDAIMKEAKNKGWFRDVLKVGRTALDAIKDPAKAMKTIGLDFVAEGFDTILTELVLLEHADELAAIADREEVLTKLIADDRLKEVRSKLVAAQQTLQASRIALLQAAIRRTVALGDAKHQLVRMSLIEEGDEKRGVAAPKLFRAIAKYHSVTDNMARFVDVSTEKHYAILMNGPSAKAGYLYHMLRKDIIDVKGWKGDFSTWLTVAEDTRTFLGQHDEWYKRQIAECLRLMDAYDGRAHWKFTEAVVAHTLLVMEQGGK